MKRIILFIGISLNIGLAHAQSTVVSDSLLAAMCTGLHSSVQTNDSLKFMEMVGTHLFPAVTTLDETAAKEAVNYALIRMQKLCPEFADMALRMQPAKGDWISLQTKPASILTAAECKSFLSYKHHYYIDGSGDTANVTMGNGLWREHFNDGSFSKCSMKWLSDSEFEVVFIESNNTVKSSLSVAGDTYKYQLIEKRKDYFLVYMDLPKFKMTGTFHVYYY